jgi:cytochrome c-type biogenesis protein CcmE
MRLAFSLAYLLSLVAVLGLNFYAVKNPEKLISLPRLLSQLLEQPANRLAVGIIWWWLGWHFLYSSL